MNDSELKLSSRTDPELSRGISWVIFLALWVEIKMKSFVDTSSTCGEVVHSSLNNYQNEKTFVTNLICNFL